jgi:hypothetical protein
LDAGKSPAQLFSGSCAACHSTPRGLLKSVAPGQLPGFLRQHYTTGSEAASTLAGYLIQNGAGVKADAPAARTAPKGTRKGPEAPSAATADAPAAQAKGKGRQTTTVPTADGTPADGQVPAAKRQATGRKKGDDKRSPAVAAPEPAPAAAPAAVATPETKPESKPDSKPEAVAAPEVKPETVPEKKPEAPPAPLPVEAETPPAPPAAAVPAEASKPAAEPGPVIIVVPRPESSASEGQPAPAATAPQSAPPTATPSAASTPAAPAPEAPPAAAPSPPPAAPSGDAPK